MRGNGLSILKLSGNTWFRSRYDAKTPIHFVDANCVLCNTGHMENFDHIFYACPYSSYVWKAMLNWLGYHRQISSWESEVKWIILE
ncbi:hypothetical protein MTR67_007686 [Solanum verrucosum]|uniref:Reverse transcriptase zinc-binding domain-containing protein n=1 Tax=Solanum verrucosum TaxID=315347 RepID=A0AAF0TCY9_SOLVR|nr:hypothetical protein MTR67_007686 [Solanum verrucosum]